MEDERKIVREIQGIAGSNDVVDWANNYMGRGYDYSVKRDFEDRLLRARVLFEKLENDDSRFEALMYSNLIANYKCVDMIESDELKAKIINELIHERKTSMDEERFLFALDSHIAYAIAGLKDDKLREEFLGHITVRNGGKSSLALITASFRSEDKRKEFMKRFKIDEYDIKSAESSFKSMIGRDIRDDGDKKAESEDIQGVKPEAELGDHNEVIVPQPDTEIEIASDIESHPEVYVEVSESEIDETPDLEGMSLEQLEQLESQEDQRISDIDAQIKEQQEKQKQEIIRRIREKMEERKQKESILAGLLRDSQDIYDGER